MYCDQTVTTTTNSQNNVAKQQDEKTVNLDSHSKHAYSLQEGIDPIYGIGAEIDFLQEFNEDVGVSFDRNDSYLDPNRVDVSTCVSSNILNLYCFGELEEDFHSIKEPHSNKRINT